MNAEPEFFEGKGKFDYQAMKAGGGIVFKRRPRLSSSANEQQWKLVSRIFVPQRFIEQATARFVNP